MKRLAALGPGPLLGLFLLAIFVACAIAGPILAPYSPTAQSDAILRGPSAAHWLGTDDSGRDLLSELLCGARVSAGIALFVVSISFAIGTAFGTLAGYLGGWLDEAMMRIVDVLLAFPGILLNIAIVALSPRPGIGQLVFALSVNGWVGYARLARGQVLQLRDRDFVQAARAVGASPLRVMWRHVVPNALSPLVVQATFGLASVILVEATLAFLGIGRAAPYSWGAILDQGITYLWRTQRLALAPGLCIGAVVLGCNLLGDALRDRLDPRAS